MSNRSIMTVEEEQLWTSIRQFELDDDSSFTFSGRLCRENRWTHEFTIRAIDEYKKFMFLLMVSEHPLTPSDAVDQVWHLHLIYTHSYWKEFCGKILHREIHHGPTKGGQTEQKKFAALYENTLELYLKFFGHRAPVDVWPNADIRFRDIHFQRVNMQTHWIVKKPFS